jgi:hypothetical protein
MDQPRRLVTGRAAQVVLRKKRPSPIVWHGYLNGLGVVMGAGAMIASHPKACLP